MFAMHFIRSSSNVMDLRFLTLAWWCILCLLTLSIPAPPLYLICLVIFAYLLHPLITFMPGAWRCSHHYPIYGLRFGTGVTRVERHPCILLHLSVLSSVAALLLLSF